MPTPDDLASALADKSKLGTYKGQQVIGTSVSIRNAGDGLSEGLSISPEVFDVNSTLYVVLECEVDAHDYKRVKARGDVVPGVLVLDQVLKAGTATIVDGDLVTKHLDEQRERIDAARAEAERRKEAADGIGRLPDDEAAAAAQADHDKGAHATGYVPGCPSCDEEREAMEAERREDVANAPVDELEGKRAAKAPAKKAPAKKAAAAKKATPPKADG